jgi:restriction system protein
MDRQSIEIIVIAVMVVVILITAAMFVWLYINNVKRGNRVTDSISEAIILSNKNYDSLGGQEFKRFCAVALEKNGYINVETVITGGNDETDLFAVKDGISFAVQCRRSDSLLGSGAVREANSLRVDYKKNAGVVLTNQYFTADAIEAAGQAGVALWDRDHLEQLIKTAGIG